MAGLLLACAAAPAAAQAPAQPPGVVDQLVVDKLVWSVIAALDHANQTGNYSVLRDMGAPSFQERNSAATLGGIFEAIRNQRIDLSNTLLVAPTYDGPPTLIQGGHLRARGIFPLRPTAIGFDIIFQNVSGRWRLLGLSVAPAAAQQPAQPNRR
jgi:hypothetical protein